MDINSSHNPLISVIFPVYNAEKFIKESIESILNQTYKNFEFIIINDGSKDNSAEIIKSYKDQRIRYYEQKNQGLAKTLNVGLSYAKGKYIARQDNDDISFPNRFEKQISYLEQNQQIAVLGSWAKIIDENGIFTNRFHHHSTSPLNLKFELVFDNPFVHSSIMARKDIIEKTGMYHLDNDYFEDYNLWSRISYHYQIANINEELLLYREVNTGMSKTTNSYKTRVIHQCVLNLNHYLPEQINLNKEIALIYHSQKNKFTSEDKALLKKSFINLIYLFDKNMNKVYSQHIIDKHILIVELNYLREKISNKKSNFLVVILSKIKRRIVLNKLLKY